MLTDATLAEGLTSIRMGSFGPFDVTLTLGKGSFRFWWTGQTWRVVLLAIRVPESMWNDRS